MNMETDIYVEATPTGHFSEFVGGNPRGAKPFIEKQLFGRDALTPTLAV